MKKLISVFVVILMFVSACANGTSEKKATVEEKETTKKLKVITTIFPQYDFTRQIGKENVDVRMLLKPGAESHSYEPTPQDIKDIQSADLFIYTGGENDYWVKSILESMGDKAPDTLKLIDLVNTVEEEIVEGMEHNHDHEHEDEHKDGEEEHDEHEESVHEIDEHVWTSPLNAIEITKKISEVLQEKDSEHAEEFKNNTEEYIKQLEDLDAKFEKTVSEGNHKTLVFGDRFPFRYLADRYGLEYYAAFSGCSSDTEASPLTVAFLIDKVKEKKIPVVFSIELSNGNIADTISEATGAKRLVFNSCHNLTKDDLDNNETYISVMERNIENLKEALK